jgi:hypothetical protein
LARFRKLQAVYIPAAVRELQEQEDAHDPDLPPPKAEDVKLYLPSGSGPGGWLPQGPARNRGQTSRGTEA